MNSTVRVFLCSTYTDLVIERNCVLDAIRRMDVHHDSMEFFGARDNRPIETCLAEVSRSDLLIVIVGHRYGDLVPELNISFSEAEYKEGKRLDKPCLVYFRDEDVPVLPRYVERDSEKTKLLESWKRALAQRHTVMTFRDPHQLGLQVAADLNRAIPQLLQSSLARPTLNNGESRAQFPYRVIHGSVPRTEFIADQLEGLFLRKDRELRIYEQGAFSTFGMTFDLDVLKTSPDYTDAYYQAVRRQQDLLDKLVRQKRSSFKLIINPVRALDLPRLPARFDSLLKWLTDPAIVSDERIDFVEAKYEGPNRLIVEESFCVEGYKLHDTSGYEFSIVATDEPKLKEAVDAFERVFQKAKRDGSTKQAVIERVTRLRDERGV